MNATLQNLSQLAVLILWCGLWSLGGIWMVRSAFNLRPNEETMAGIGAGLIVQTWLANLLGRFLPAGPAFWLGAILTLLAGLGMSFPLKRGELHRLYRIQISPLQFLSLFLLSFLLIAVGRGLAILDDYQNLPTTSLLAAGDIPPHFALDPHVQFDYHYFSLLTAAEFMLIGKTYPWIALDVVRGFGTALSILLGLFWIERVTGSTLAGMISAVLGLFGGGTRWLMLFLPENVLKWMSPQIKMIGSAGQSANDLVTALTGPWAVETGAKWPMPFAFANGINVPSIWTYHSGTGGTVSVISTLLLLSHNHWRGWRGAALLAVLLAALALGSEVSLVQLIIALGVLAVVYVLLMTRGSWRKARQGRFSWKTALPKALLGWFGVLLLAGLIALVQGGVLTGAFTGLLGKMSGQAKGSGYFSLGFSLFWPPAVLSSHLGMLSLFNPAQLLAAVFEIGPLFLLLPFALVWGWKAFRAGRWYEAALIVFPVLALVTLVVQYTGNAGPTALNRVQSQIFGLARSSFAFAALWLWLQKRSEAMKTAVATLLIVGCFGGITLFGFEVLSVAEPLRSTFVTDLDARLMDQYWNRLEPGALVFDPIAWRAPTLLARTTDSNITWYQSKPEWDALAKNPAPHALRAAGFDYVYLDKQFSDKFSPALQAEYADACVKMVGEARAKRTSDFRELLDIRGCQ
jgi:hypothetical protein